MLIVNRKALAAQARQRAKRMPHRLQNSGWKWVAERISRRRVVVIGSHVLRGVGVSDWGIQVKGERQPEQAVARADCGFRVCGVSKTQARPPLLRPGSRRGSGCSVYALVNNYAFGLNTGDLTLNGIDRIRVKACDQCVISRLQSRLMFQPQAHVKCQAGSNAEVILDEDAVVADKIGQMARCRDATTTRIAQK